jgi:hypothetical protein
MLENPYPLFKDLMPFGGKLDEDNKWITLSKLVPWRKLDSRYRTYFNRTTNIKDSRLLLGILIGKHYMNLSDRGIIEYFHENPYFQYFCGFSSFVSGKESQIMHHSLLSKRRKRLGKKYFAQFEQEILQVLKENNLIKHDTLMLDATVEPANITYPNDVKLMNVAREWICKTILTVKNAFDPKKKIRTYRRIGRTVFLNFQKKKRKTKKLIKTTKNKMLRLLKRNITQLEEILKEYADETTKRIVELPNHCLDKITIHLQTAKTIYQQQQEMITTNVQRIQNRIISFHQTHIRPIVRGKEGKPTEFGPKVLLSHVGGYGLTEKISFDNFHEGILLPEALEKHKERFGDYPKYLCADQIFATNKIENY